MLSLKYKFIIILCIFLFSLIYTYPNFQGEDPAIIITKNTNSIDKTFIDFIDKNFIDNNIKKKSITLSNKNTLVIRFFSTDEQFTMYELLKSKIFDKLNITVSLNILNSVSSEFLEKLGAYPMKLGLDLRGGVHLLIKVSTKNNINSFIKGRFLSVRKKLKEHTITRYSTKVNDKNIIKLKFKTHNDAMYAYDCIKSELIDFDLIKHNANKIKIKLNKNKKTEIQKHIVEQTIYILSKRVNELGISDSVIQSQGKDKIVIEIPGIQDIARAKSIIGKTATLNFMLVDTKNNIKLALKGQTPKHSKLFYQKNDAPILIKNKSILTGDAIVHASAGFEQQLNKPCINIRLGGKDIKLFEETTMKNVGKLMAIIYKESIINNDKTLDIKETVISVATIMSALSRDFQITGLTIQESKDLALLLRSGSLPATISIIEEKVIGPSLGEKNIRSGIISICVAFIIIFLFMLAKYKFSGFIASIGLITNLLLLISVMSIIGVTLTLPGLAGITLTIGMSIDANILIFERIREEYKEKINYIYAVEQGFKNALSSIIDSNLTTLIIGLVLFMLGNGPIRGFALTLSIGIVTSIYSSIFVTRTLTEIFLTQGIMSKKNENKFC